MGFIKKKFSSSQLKNIDIKNFLTHYKKIFDLQFYKNNLMYFSCEPYKLLQWYIKPIIILNTKEGDNFLQLKSHEIEVEGIGKINEFISIFIELNFFEKNKKLIIQKEIEIIFDNKNIFKMLPNYLTNKIMDQIILLVSMRLDKKINSRLSKFQFECSY